MLIRLIACSYVVMAYFATPLLASQFSGAVCDPQGLAVAGAQVELHCANHRETTRSDSQGRFEFKEIPGGKCSLSVQHPGFALFEQRLDPGVQLVPVHLGLAEVRDHVDVVADSENVPLYDRQINSVSLSDAELKTISNNTQDWIRYAKLRAGATFGADAVYVDGLPATALPPAEMVARITVNGDPFSAEYADGDTTHIDIATKGGDRNFGFSFRWTVVRRWQTNLLASGLRAQSSSGQGDFKGYIPHIPITFAVHLNIGNRMDDQPILAVLPPSMTPGPLKISVRNSFFSGSLDAFYVREKWRAHVSFYDLRSNGSNLGAGGITLADAGINSLHDSREMRATFDEAFGKILYFGGVAVTETRTDTKANSSTAGVSVLGAFVDGGAPMTSSLSNGTHWTLKNVFQSDSTPSSWTTGLTISGEDDSKQNIPNAYGSFMFSDLQAYTEAQSGLGTGTWVLMHGNGAVSYSGLSASPFFQKTILHSKRALLTLGLRADYQSSFRAIASPRLSGAAEWHGFVFRAGFGLFVKGIASSVFLRSFDGDSAHLQETIATGVSLVNGVFGTSMSSDGLIHSQLSGDLTRPRELMQKGSVERRLGKFLFGTEYTWTHGRHLLGSQRLPDADGWVNILESNRSSDRRRMINPQVR